MKLQEFLNELSLASCPHGRTRGPYVQLCQHLERLHAQLIQNPNFAAALADEEDEGASRTTQKKLLSLLARAADFDPHRLSPELHADIIAALEEEEGTES
jgi:hypothetical protein